MGDRSSGAKRKILSGGRSMRRGRRLLPLDRPPVRRRRQNGDHAYRLDGRIVARRHSLEIAVRCEAGAPCQRSATISVSIIAMRRMVRQAR